MAFLFFIEVCMRTPIFQVDAFTTRLFAGNPAAVMPMDGFPDDAVLQAIAAENNLAETAFLVSEGSDYRLRWFTPAVEVPLCGHATLASAAVVMERLEPGRSQVVFHTASGPLTVKRTDAGYIMDFPARPSEPVSAPLGLAEALGVVPIEVFVNAFNYMAVLQSAQSVRELAPDMVALAGMDRLGVIVTAPADAAWEDSPGPIAAGGRSHRGRANTEETGPIAAGGRSHGYDFISRYFAPAKGIPEDPVTGAAHCMLAPYWAKRLGKTEFRAFQASKRGGEILCRLAGDRVELEGSCVFYMQGEVEI